MGRLEEIVARNKRPHGVRATVGMLWRGMFILLILGLMIFTDWALTDDPDVPQPRDPGEHRIEGVPLRRAPAQRP